MRALVTALNIVVYGFLAGFLLAFLLSLGAHAHADDLAPNNEPQIDNYQGSRPDTSVLVVHWPDGVTESLVYDNKAIKDGALGYLKWFSERQDAYEKRTTRD